MRKYKSRLTSEAKQEIRETLEECLEGKCYKQPLFKANEMSLEKPEGKDGLYVTSIIKEDEKDENAVPYIDHILINKDGYLTQHPYGIGMKRLKGLIKWCEKRNITFWIDAHSCYYPLRTICIEFSKKIKTESSDD